MVVGLFLNIKLKLWVGITKSIKKCSKPQNDLKLWHVVIFNNMFKLTILTVVVFLNKKIRCLTAFNFWIVIVNKMLKLATLLAKVVCFEGETHSSPAVIFVLISLLLRQVLKWKCACNCRYFSVDRLILG